MLFSGDFILKHHLSGKILMFKSVGLTDKQVIMSKFPFLPASLLVHQQIPDPGTFISQSLQTDRRGQK